MSRIFATGALACAVAVAAGAFGAHGLRGRLEPRELELWETAARYFFYSGLGQMMAALFARLTVAGGNRSARQAVLVGGCLLAGGVVFSGTVGALALGAPSWLGAVTPLGGAALIFGFLLLGWAGWREASRSSGSLPSGPRAGF